MNKPGAVVLLSGGLDSAVALASIVKYYDPVVCLGFLYGQRHLREIQSASALAAYYNVQFKTSQLSFPSPTALLDKGLDLDEMSDGLPASFVPGRNIAFIALAANLAYNLKINHIIGGWNYTDHPGYPDCRPRFLNSMTDTLLAGLGKSIFLISPLLPLTKDEIIHLGLELGVPFKLTWSCYKGGESPCGECSSCKFREEGFKKVGVPDPAR